jgi:hypothetical protein
LKIYRFTQFPKCKDFVVFREKNFCYTCYIYFKKCDEVRVSRYGTYQNGEGGLNTTSNFFSQKFYLLTFFFSLYVFGEPVVHFCNFCTSVVPHRGHPAAKCHLRWQPIRRLAVSCGLGRHRIRTRDCRTTVWRATIELPWGLNTTSNFFFSNILFSNLYYIWIKHNLRLLKTNL